MTERPIAVVTGASRGIGAACVEVLADRGYLVVGVSRSASAAEEHVAVDLASPDCGRTVGAQIGDRDVAVLVNNAALAVYTTAEETPIETWDGVLDVNLRSAFLTGVALLPALRRAWGSVVNVASVHAAATSVAVAAYAASKGGMVALTRALALEWAPEVRVNCVLPGAVDTPMLREGLFRTEATVESLGRRHPLGRVGEPSEIAEVIAFLAGRESSFVTGSCIAADGGALARLSTE